MYERYIPLAESEGFEPSRPRLRPTWFPIMLLQPTRTALQLAPQVGFEPTTDRLTADCSTTELLWNNGKSLPVRLSKEPSKWHLHLLAYSLMSDASVLLVADSVEVIAHCSTTELLWNKDLYLCTIINDAWQRPTLAETTSQLPSALESLTAVFGMGTGVTSLP